MSPQGRENMEIREEKNGQGKVRELPFLHKVRTFFKDGLLIQ